LDANRTVVINPIVNGFSHDRLSRYRAAPGGA
jgi:hypothetical protein